MLSRFTRRGFLKLLAFSSLLMQVRLGLTQAWQLIARIIVLPSSLELQAHYEIDFSVIPTLFLEIRDADKEGLYLHWVPLTTSTGDIQLSISSWDINDGRNYIGSTPIVSTHASDTSRDSTCGGGSILLAAHCRSA